MLSLLFHESQEKQRHENAAGHGSTGVSARELCSYKYKAPYIKGNCLPDGSLAAVFDNPEAQCLGCATFSYRFAVIYGFIYIGFQYF